MRILLTLLFIPLAIAAVFFAICGIETLRYTQPKTVPSGESWAPDIKDFRGIIHCHSELSFDSWGSLEDIRKAATARNIDFVVMTDHWSPELWRKSYRGMYGSVLFISGTELHQKDKMSLLAFPLPSDFVPKERFEDNIEALRKGGALVYGAHIEKATDQELSRFDRIELMNLHAYALRRGSRYATKAFFRSLWRGGDVRFLMGNIDVARRWERLEAAHGESLPMIVGTDVHVNWVLLLLFGKDVYGRNFDIMTTHVLAPELSQESIIQALRAGHNYVSFDILGAPQGFRFYAQSGKRTLLPGDSAALQPGQTLIYNAPEGSNNAELHRNGKSVLLLDGSAVIPVKKPGMYHIEVKRGNKLWIVSNSIEIK